MTTIRLMDIAYRLPATVVTNDELARDNPDWDIDRIERRVGVRARHIAAPGETALDLALAACRALFVSHPELPDRIDAVLFCTQSPDFVMPPNSALLHGSLDLPESVFTLDYTLACSGYVYGLALAAGLAASGIARDILLVTGDTYSKYINPLDRSARVLFGDGAAVSWLSATDEPGLIDILCGTVGKEGDAFRVPAGGCRLPRSAETSRPIRDLVGNVRTAEQIHMDGRAVLEFMKRVIPTNIRELLGRNDLAVEAIDGVIFHQASALALDWIEREMGVDDGRSFRNLASVGNTVSASIPIALSDAMTEGVVGAGDRVLLVGFGVGLSFGSAILQL
jgi:3-oxoacyl-[acyl-carrier-protein] synthase-3